MKLALTSSKSAAGSILLIAAGTVAILGIGLGSYLWMVRVQAVSIDSSQHWNAALAHAEAGVEEAMAHLNYRFTTNINRADNGWGGPSGGYYGPISRQLARGGYDAIMSTDLHPVIYSTGYTVVPISGAVLKRTVRVQAGATGPFQVGMAAKLNITFRGNNIYIDSFDSADPNHSTNEKYDPTKAKAGGDVASTEGLVNVGQADIKGKLKVGPTGTWSIGNNGSVGDVDHPINSGQIQEGWVENDFNYEFKDVQAPDGYTSWTAPVDLPKQSNSNRWELAGNYVWSPKVSDSFLAGDIIWIKDNTVLVVDGNFKMTGDSKILIEPGANFEIFVMNGSTDFTTVNTSGDASTFSYYGLPSNPAVTWGGNDEYVGTVYAPQATFTMGGGGSDIRDYMGACVVKDIVLNGHFNFHYDENLKRKAKPVGFTVGSWHEL